MILADTKSGADSEEGIHNRRAMLDLVRGRGVSAVADQMVGKLLGETTRRERPEIVAEVRRLIETNQVSGVEAAIYALMHRPDSTADLPNIQCPTLVLVGDEDTLTPPSEAEQLHKTSLVVSASARQSSSSSADPLHRPLDQILDLHVRDGLVYYRALQSSRGSLDRYVASLNVPAATYEGWAREAKMAFWANAYNAIVLQTVIARYPIRGTSSAYPAASIRQIPGAFDQKHRVAGRTVSLDEIEKKVIPEFNEPRLLLALGRGAVGSSRLRSEAYAASRLQSQFDAIQSEFVNEQHMLRVDRDGGVVSATPILSWNQEPFIAAYAKSALGQFESRSPIERALIAFVMPHLLPLEKEFVERNQFKVTFHPFDWRLNDLTGGRVE
jgi:hypothetical protein